MNRIIKAGGYTEHKRVNGRDCNRQGIQQVHKFISQLTFVRFLGILALSRALGDFEFKNNTSVSAGEQIVTGNVRVNQKV